MLKTSRALVALGAAGPRRRARAPLDGGGRGRLPQRQRETGPRRPAAELQHLLGVRRHPHSAVRGCGRERGRHVAGRPVGGLDQQPRLSRPAVPRPAGLAVRQHREHLRPVGDGRHRARLGPRRGVHRRSDQRCAAEDHRADQLRDRHRRGVPRAPAAAKAAFSHPRPYLPTDPTKAAPAGDNPGCDPATYNGAGQASVRVGKPWADADGNLLVNRVAATTDTTQQFASNNVPLDPDYATDTGICAGGSFPSGHTLTAYEAGITLATLVPELAPEILTRASENGINRNVLGVHYPLDIMGGRIAGQAAIAARWSDATYRDQVLVPARTELVDYLRQACGAVITVCAARQQAYTSNPFGGAAMPGGTAQIVTDRVSALATFTERLTYGFPRVTAAGQPATVPAGASNLLLTTFPTLTDAQRTAVLAQTEIDSGFPLDGTGTAAGSWERLNLAAATSATVQVAADGSVQVTATGGTARVVVTTPGTTTPPPTTPPTSVGPILANTGAETTPLTLVSIILLASGGAILVGSHRLGRRSGAHRG